MKRVLLFSLIILMYTSPALASKQKIMVFDFRGIYAMKEILTAGSYLLKQDLIQTGVLDVLDADNFTDASTCYDASCAVPIAESHGADKAVTGTMIVIGNKIIVESTVFDVKTKDPVLYNSLTAESPSDIDAVMHKLSDAIAKNEPVSNVTTLNNITQQETTQPRRVKSSVYMGLDMGVIVPVASSYLNAGSLNDIDLLVFNYEVDDHIMLQFKPVLGFSWNSSSNPSVFDWRIMQMGAYYASSIRDISPFVGGRISMDLLNMSKSATQESEAKNYNNTEFGLFLGGGLIFFRTSSTHLYIEVGYQAFLDNFDGNGAHGVSFNTGILFHI